MLSITSQSYSKLSPLARKLKVVSSLVLHEIDDLMTVSCFFMAGEISATNSSNLT